MIFLEIKTKTKSKKKKNNNNKNKNKSKSKNKKKENINLTKILYKTDTFGLQKVNIKSRRDKKEICGGIFGGTLFITA